MSPPGKSLDVIRKETRTHGNCKMGGDANKKDSFSLIG
jgi:hypothetical protein